MTALYLRFTHVLFFFSDFSSKALTDIERFQNQKVLDLRDTLGNYTYLQLKTARKVAIYFLIKKILKIYFIIFNAPPENLYIFLGSTNLATN